MATVTRRGETVETVGNLPAVGRKAPDFVLVKPDLSELRLVDLKGKRLVLNIFPSIDTPTCATSVREFNKKVTSTDDIVVCVSADLPFALGQFCGAQGIKNVLVASSFRSSFGQDYEVAFISGPLTGLLSRAVVVIGTDGKILYTEQVADTSQQPNYDKALSILRTNNS
jgi:thiol peroxidase